MPVAMHVRQSTRVLACKAAPTSGIANNAWKAALTACSSVLVPTLLPVAAYIDLIVVDEGMLHPRRSQHQVYHKPQSW